jgi:hypothetical protein
MSAEKLEYFFNVSYMLIVQFFNSRILMLTSTAYVAFYKLGSPSRDRQSKVPLLLRTPLSVTRNNGTLESIFPYPVIVG